MRGNLWDPVLVEPDPDHLLVSSDGTVREHHNLILSEDMSGQVQSGYRCIQCLEPFEEAWPERCPACKFAVRDKQAQRFGQEYVGNIRVGPSTSIEDELAIAEEMVEREERKKNDVSVRKPSIIIPRTW